VQGDTRELVTYLAKRCAPPSKAKARWYKLVQTSQRAYVLLPEIIQLNVNARMPMVRLPGPITFEPMKAREQPKRPKRLSSLAGAVIGCVRNPRLHPHLLRPRSLSVRNTTTWENPRCTKNMILNSLAVAQVRL
jgi:hypothetical protein